MSEDTFTTPDGGFGRNAAAPAPPERSLIYRIGRRCRPAIDKFLAVHSEVGDAAVFESRQFPWTAEQERRWPPRLSRCCAT
jgi:hypothetical protein